eukprot:scaffold637506_cov42-Prasinocladus_malaysianus.AAC.1
MSVTDIKDNHQLRQHKWKKIEWIVSAFYTAACSLYIVGSSFFFLILYNRYHAGAWMFVWGSVLFMIGAIINMQQLYIVTSSFSVQLLNATAI